MLSCAIVVFIFNAPVKENTSCRHGKRFPTGASSWKLFFSEIKFLPRGYKIFLKFFLNSGLRKILLAGAKEEQSFRDVSSLWVPLCDKNFIISPSSVEVTKGTRKASTSILLTVVEGNPPDVWVGEAKKKIVAGDRVTLEGYFNTTVQPAKVEWSCVREQGGLGLF